jgi:hypothetical protein
VNVQSTNSDWTQLFRYNNGMVINVKGKVMQVDNNRDTEGANVGVGNKAGTKNQKWSVVYTDKEDKFVKPVKTYKKGETNPDFGLKVGIEFSLVTRMSCARMIDYAGNTMVVKRKNGFKSQRWVFSDETKTIQSVGFPGKSWGLHADGKNRAVDLYKTTSKWFQTFKYKNENFVNARGLVLEVEGNKCTEGSRVIANKKHNGSN